MKGQQCKAILTLGRNRERDRKYLNTLSLGMCFYFFITQCTQIIPQKRFVQKLNRMHFL